MPTRTGYRAPERVPTPEWNFPAELKRAMREAELTVEATAYLIGVSRQTVYNYLAGTYHPSYAEWLKLCVLFGWAHPALGSEGAKQQATRAMLHALIHTSPERAMPSAVRRALRGNVSPTRAGAVA